MTLSGPRIVNTVPVVRSVLTWVTGSNIVRERKLPIVVFPSFVSSLDSFSVGRK